MREGNWEEQEQERRGNDYHLCGGCARLRLGGCHRVSLAPFIPAATDFPCPVLVLAGLVFLEVKAETEIKGHGKGSIG